MMKIFLNVRDEKFIQTLTSFSILIDFLEKPVEGCVLIHDGEVDYSKETVFLPEPYPFDFFSALFLSKTPDVNVKSPVPISACDDILEKIIELLIEGEEISTTTLSSSGCWSRGDFLLLESTRDLEEMGKSKLGFEPLDLEEKRIFRLLGKGVISIEDARKWLFGKRFLESVHLELPDEVNPMERIKVRTRASVSLEIGGRDFKMGELMINGILKDNPGNSGKATLKIDMGDLKFEVFSRRYKVKVAPSFDAKIFLPRKVKGAVCDEESLYIWNESDLEIVDIATKATIWKVHIKPISAVINGRYMYLVDHSNDLVVLDVERREELFRERLDSRISFSELCDQNLIMMSHSGFLIYDLSIPSRPTRKFSVPSTGLMTCLKDLVCVAGKDGVSVYDVSGNLRGYIPTVERVWDVISVNGKLILAFGKRIELFDEDLNRSDEVILHEDVDSMKSWRDILVILTKGGKVVFFRVEEKLKNLGELVGRFTDVVTCKWLFAVSEIGIHGIMTPTP